MMRRLLLDTRLVSNKLSGFGLAALLVSVAATTRAQTYTAIDLETPPGTAYTPEIGVPLGLYDGAHGMNNSGQVVGVMGATNFYAGHAFLNSGGTTFDLGRLTGGNYSYAFGINNSGQVVGWSGNVSPIPIPPNAFLYSGGRMFNLGTLPGGDTSLAFGINDRAQVVGSSNGGGNNTFHAVLYSVGGMIDLGTLPGNLSATAGGSLSMAYGINNTGQIVGWSNSVSGYEHAFLYRGGSMVDLGTLPTGTFSRANGINTSGQVVGIADSASGSDHAFLYSGGPMVDLGTLPGGHYSQAFAINDSGQVVGSADRTNGSAAFLYSGGAMIDLNNLVTLPAGVSLTQAVGINNLGQIAANGNNGHSYLLTPQNTTLALLQIGLEHIGNFSPGQNGATYSASVSNATGAGPTSGKVTLTETVPAGLTLVSMAGTGWTCLSGGITCTRSDVLSAGGNYAAVTVTVNVGASATSPEVNSVSVSGGGSATATAANPTTIVGACSYTLNPTSSLVAFNGGTDLFSVTTSAECFWTAVTNASWLTVTSGASGSGNGTVGYSVAANPNGTARSGTVTIARQTLTVTQAGVTVGCSYSLSSASALVAFNSGTGSLAVTTSAECSWAAASNASWLTVTSGAAGSGNGGVGYSFAANPTGTQRSGTLTAAGQTFTVLQAGVAIAAGQGPLRFVPVTPCRIADTRIGTGTFGGPAMAANVPRDFPVPSSSCGIPANALAYSLNLTVVPLGPLGFLQVFPAGQGQPSVSTLNSGDGRVKANAAIVPAGVNGAVTLFASNPTHAIVDINGYFVPIGGAQNLAFYPIAPCRLADTRGATGTFGGPVLAGNASRNFPVLAGPCGIPASAQAYAFNMTVVPTGPLGFLSAWPTGNPQPGSSTLNAPTGTVTANMAIVPAGTGGAITVISTNTTDLIVDITGYFAPPGAGSLDFFTATPCRILDTRFPVGPFGGPVMGAGETRSFAVPSSSCGTPTTAKAYSLNATVVPPGTLGFLTLWGSGVMPFVSTLNSFDGTVVANAALVPAGASGEVTAFTSDPTHLILDINGYFQLGLGSSGR